MKTPNIEDDSKLVSAPLSEIIAHVIETHHAFVRTQSEFIEQLIDELLSLNEDNPRIAELRLLNRTLISELTDHMRKEEDVLFPAIIGLENAAKRKKTDSNLLPFKVSNRVRLLMLEDEGTGYLLKHLTRGILAFEPPPQSKALYQKVLTAIQSFEADLKRHIYLENSILFPNAINVEKELLSR